MKSFLVFILCFGIAGSSLGLVKIQHDKRQHITQLQKLKQEQQNLQDQWAQLQLEEGAYIQHARVANEARIRLGMSDPTQFETARANRGQDVAQSGYVEPIQP